MKSFWNWLNNISGRMLGATALCLLTVASTLTVAGCNQTKATQVAQTIVTWTPAIDSAVQTTATIVESLSAADPAAQAVESIAAGALHGAGVLISNAAKAYIANPTSSTLQALQTIIVSAQQSFNQALLQAAQIKDAASQQKVLGAVNGIGTVLTTVLALVQSISSSAQLKAMAAQSPIKFVQVEPLMDTEALNRAGEPYNVSSDHFFQLEALSGF